MKRLVLAALLLTSCGKTPAPQESPLATITEKATALQPELISIRRDLHRHPELSGTERRTAGVVAERLTALGLEVRTGIGGHGVVGILRGGRPGPVVAYRADMDAVVGQEPPGREYGSTVPGVQHVCGHDLHTAIGIGVASILSSLREQMPGTAVFLFQPAEENIQGAQAMIRDGALVDPRPDVIYALHSFPFRVGTVAQGAVFAGLDQFTLELTGEHATSAVAQRLQARLSEFGTVAPLKQAEQVAPYLADIQKPGGPYSTAIYMNVKISPSDVPTRFLVRGTVKASSDSMYPQLRQSVKEAVERELGATGYQLSFRDAPFPSMSSDPQVTAGAAPTLAEAVGEGNVLTLHATHIYSGEDFALFLQQLPGTMFLLGVANPARGILGAPHFPDFDADEESILIGTKAMSSVLWQRLSQS
ncbi:M20 metallopeptidase family protein [Hyalangium rubrum]|uniref:M20 family metallopeptidase n=1 Tax=Hyalangium rubrum TaxID=3103134 RepID=A0ABU5H9Z0_9BACT|nr:M20 family metallopeptidase [Hyalangium sp. s54d21]MDY7229587.1 M20 family metallopeptidase [Hyalangium sp. s54d21]